jgi:hypothetical protein
MNTRGVLFVSGGFLVCVLAMTVLGGSLSDTYVEDFSTKQYCNAAQTTAWWDTLAGELKLHPFELTLAGSYDTPGEAYGVAVAGDYAYVADFETGGLQVIDITDPASPAFAGSYDPGGYAFGVAVSGNYAYVTNFTLGLQAIDISDPENPALAGSYDTPGTARHVVVAGDYAYVADMTSGLLVIDISDPENPTLTGSYDTADEAHGVAVAGTYAYVADFNSGLVVVDISDRSNPTRAGGFDTPGSAERVAVDGDYAFVANHYSGLTVYDISDPESPTLAGSYDTFRAFDVCIVGNFAYVADAESGLVAIDIIDPTNPRQVGSLTTPDAASGVAVAGEHAFVADYLSGLQVIDVFDVLATPLYAGGSTDIEHADDIATSGEYAYVADSGGGLKIFDVSDPTNPVRVGQYEPGITAAVEVDGDYAYVASRYTPWDSCLVIDVSDPTNPTSIGGCRIPATVYEIDVEGTIAVVAMEVTDPRNPINVGNYDTPGYAYGVAIDGNYAFVADSDVGGLQIVDISDPAHPTYAGSYATPTFTMNVKVQGDYAYVAHHNAGILVIDVSDPTSPSLVGSYNTPVRAMDLVLDGDYAIVADWDNTGTSGGSTIQILDISDPANPTFVASHPTLDVTRGITVAGDFAFVADGWGGIHIIEVFQRLYDLDRNVGHSAVMQQAQEITKVKFTTTETDSVRWEVSGDAGTHWQEVEPDTNWWDLSVSGTDLVWRTTHVYARPRVNPSCSSLEIELEYLSPTLIQDFAAWPGDGRIELAWDVFSDEGLEGFAIYRAEDGGKTTRIVQLLPPQQNRYVDEDVRGGRTYRYTLGVVLEDGSEVRSRTLAVKSKAYSLTLYQNHPNPFNPVTTISFALPDKAWVNLSVYNAEGKLVNTISDKAFGEGTHEVEWDGTDATGSRVGSGVYFYRLQVGKRVLTKKMILLK